MSETDTSMTREQAQSRARGALVLAGFGAVWMAMGLAQTHRTSAGVLLPLGVVCALLLAGMGQAMRRSHDLPSSHMSTDEQVRVQRMFTAVSIILWVSIATAVSVLYLLHMPEYIVPAISMLVGLHLFPLAGSFRNRQHYYTGALLLLWPLGCLAWLPPTRVSGVCASGVGAVLLLSAVFTLARTFAASRMGQPQSAIARG